VSRDGVLTEAVDQFAVGRVEIDGFYKIVTDAESDARQSAAAAGANVILDRFQFFGIAELFEGIGRADDCSSVAD
jgi:hypothetical protein